MPRTIFPGDPSRARVCIPVCCAICTRVHGHFGERGAFLVCCVGGWAGNFLERVCVRVNEGVCYFLLCTIEFYIDVPYK